MNIIMLVPVVLPIIAGLLVGILKMEDKRLRQTFVASVVGINCLIMLYVLFNLEGQSLSFIKFNDVISFTLSVDKMSIVFGSLVSILWFVTTFYAFGYMSHEGGEVRFFTFFTMTLGVVNGLALSNNAMTLYLFYEFLTLFTFPLVTHTQTAEAMEVGKKYLLYSFFGASLAFMSVVFLQYAGSNAGFVYGGFIDPEKLIGGDTLLNIVYIVGFLGYGVKAAVWPVHGWLPSAYVAPTPATALLHAVAVVKAGIFAIMRLTYFSFDPEFLHGSWAQVVVFILVCITILYGSSTALRTTYLKKRLAYSTVSQLSYVLLAVVMMSGAGLVGGLVHMIFHAIIKITLFFCTGSILYSTHITEVGEMEGIAKYMPQTMAVFVIASFGLVGLPPTAGLISKIFIGEATLTTGNGWMGMIGIVVLMLSAGMTALYLLPFSYKAYLPLNKDKVFKADKSMEAPATMTIPQWVLAVVIVVLGVVPGIITDYISNIVGL